MTGNERLRVDRTSLLVEVDASLPLAECEAALRTEGLTLDIGPEASGAIGAWLEAGAPGARDPWLDPADHLVAALDATLLDGRQLEVRPAPRRAVGPDLVALVVGMRGRYAKVTRAFLRVHPVGVARPSTPPVTADRAPILTEGESALLDRIAHELGER